MTTTCPVCRWENEADSGPCAGCGADLATGAAPESRPAPEPPRESRLASEAGPPPDDAPGSDPGRSIPTVAPVRSPVPISPAGRATPRVVEPPRGGPRPVERPRSAPLPPPQAGMARRPPPEVRAIPVTVASSGVRPAVHMRAGRPDAPATVSPEQVLPGPGDVICRSCGRPVPAGRRFCRCGNQVSTAVARETPSPAPAAGMSKGAFRRAQRAANGGRRPRYDAPLAARTWLVRALAALLVVGAVGSQAPPWGEDVRGWIETRVEQVIPGR